MSPRPNNFLIIFNIYNFVIIIIYTYKEELSWRLEGECDEWRVIIPSFQQSNRTVR